jgi:hypothetical protein
MDGLIEAVWVLLMGDWWIRNRSAGDAGIRDGKGAVLGVISGQLSQHEERIFGVAVAVTGFGVGF